VASKKISTSSLARSGYRPEYDIAASDTRDKVGHGAQEA
jgi:hypothetical protein